ncbi:unnamed protein product [Hydatigera taeniaeformis]|uniref:Uncharacterized protein n=1 Tax=Hydatigena taeniaeformis TaxID=6205 RepID=A0A0R3WUB2_HYDTA|nr:unnamed protein product [Hydatigera taeniaeformis]
MHDRNRHRPVGPALPPQHSIARAQPPHHTALQSVVNEIAVQLSNSGNWGEMCAPSPPDTPLHLKSRRHISVVLHVPHPLLRSVVPLHPTSHHLTSRLTRHPHYCAPRLIVTLCAGGSLSDCRLQYQLIPHTTPQLHHSTSPNAHPIPDRNHGLLSSPDSDPTASSPHLNSGNTANPPHLTSRIASCVDACVLELA